MTSLEFGELRAMCQRITEDDAHALLWLASDAPDEQRHYIMDHLARRLPEHIDTLRWCLSCIPHTEALLRPHNDEDARALARQWSVLLAWAVIHHEGRHDASGVTLALVVTEQGSHIATLRTWWLENHTREIRLSEFRGPYVSQLGDSCVWLVEPGSGSMGQVLQYPGLPEELATPLHRPSTSR